MLSNVSIWDVIYEHYSYFSPESLARLFILNGFHICDLGEQYGGQYLSVDARPEELEDVHLDLPYVHGESLAIKAHEFNLKSRLKIETWMNNLARMNNEGDTAVIWGAGSKGINFLNLLSEQQVIEYVVDINPRKHSMYISVTGQQIVPPVFLKDYQPNIVIMMNPLYADEIRKALDTLDIDVDLLFA